MVAANSLKTILSSVDSTGLFIRRVEGQNTCLTILDGCRSAYTYHNLGYPLQ